MLDQFLFTPVFSSICSSLHHSSSVIDHFHTDPSHPIMVYHYFDFRDATKQTVSGLLTSILIQLAERSSACHALLKEFRSSFRGRSIPDDAALQSTVIDMLRACGTLFLIVDALDECPQRERIGMFLFFKSFRDMGLDLHLLITSRREPDIQQEMESKSLCTHSCSLDHEAHHLSTLGSHIQMMLSSGTYDEWAPHIKEKAGHILESKAEGM